MKNKAEKYARIPKYLEEVLRVECLVGEVLVDESKWHIDSDEAVKRIRKHLQSLNFVSDIYVGTSVIYDWLEEAEEAIKKQTPTFVTCPKGYQGVRDTRYYCPSCKKAMRRYETHCHNCGQAVKYPKEKCIDNKIVLDWGEE